jgi:D-alanyl-D-alanine carboxypeptidase (penicillin-binding protein 5/6)
MRKRICVLVTVLCLLGGIPHALAAGDPPRVSAESMILIDADTGSVLCEKNADRRMLIASTTKILTALVALSYCDPDETVTIKPEYTGIEGSSMYLKAGDIYTLRELLYGMMLVSGNDAAMAVACYTAGSVDHFAILMNRTAAQLGLQNSSFKNPSGLDEEGHYSCARDLAVLTAAAMQNSLFAEIVGTKSCTIHGLTLVNHNKLLWNCDGALGVKTGYTSAAGRSLVSCMERDGMRMGCVTLDDPDDWKDHAALCDWACAAYHCVTYPAGTVLASLPVVSGAAETVDAVLSEDLKLSLDKDKEAVLSLRLPRFVFAEVTKGEKAGTDDLCVDGVALAEAKLVYGGDVSLTGTARLKAWDRFRRSLELLGRYSPYSYYSRL